MREGADEVVRMGPGGLTRREFLAAGTGALAGLYVLGSGYPGARDAEAQALELEVLGGFPRAFHFREPEYALRTSNPPSYEAWEKRFLALNGIMGKVCNEAQDYTGRNNREFFLRFKQGNPNKAVFLHYNGTGRRAADSATTDFFAGHWLHYEGTRLSRPVGAQRRANVLGVRDTSVFRLRRTGGIRDDIAIARAGRDGRPDWSTAEQLQLRDIGPKNKTITVQRGVYGTRVRAFPAGSYLAAHVTTGPHHFLNNRSNTPLWSYNFATVGPRDRRGRNGGDALVDYLAGRLGPGGDLEVFDGVIFDVLSSIVRFGSPTRAVDVNTDGRADGGVVGGRNVVGLGVVDFTRALRERLPGKIIMADGHVPGESQRAFGNLNGIETEGYPDKYDIELDSLSRGENIFDAWAQNNADPQLNYVNFKYKDRRPDRNRNTFVEPTLSRDRSYKKLRLVLASAVFSDAALAYSDDWAPPATLWRQGNAPVRVFDELWQGTEQRTNWLGAPLGPAMYLAGDTPDLLEGQGESWTPEFVSRFGGENVRFAREEAPPGMIVSTVRPDNRVPVLSRTTSFGLPGIQLTGADLFVSLRLNAEPLAGYPASYGRRVGLVATSDRGRQLSSFAWAHAEPSTATFYFKNLGPGPVSLGFRVEGDRPVRLVELSAHSETNAAYREFENGAVFANYSTRPHTFDLAQLFPATSFRKIQGSERQDPAANNGQPLDGTLTLPPKDALFVTKSVV